MRVDVVVGVVQGGVVGRQCGVLNPEGDQVMATLQSQLATMSHEQLVAMVAQMQTASQRKLTLKVSGKGAVSLYGMGRFPVTLYGEQWERLLGEAEQIKAFITMNRSLLSVKGAA